MRRLQPAQLDLLDPLLTREVRLGQGETHRLYTEGGVQGTDGRQAGVGAGGDGGVGQVHGNCR